MKTKIKTYKLYLFAFLPAFIALSCEDQLKEVPYDQLSPSIVLTEVDGLESVLASAYGWLQTTERNFRIMQYNYLEEGPSDLFWETDGGQGPDAALIQDFIWGPEHDWIKEVYISHWYAIKDANLFLANVNNVDVYPNRDSRIGEAKFILAFKYHLLTKWWGEVPLIVTDKPDPFPAKTPIDDIYSFIEDELIAAADMLPVTQDEFGRITKGGALGILTKHYLNTKQWQKAADYAKIIMDMDVYELYPDYEGLFAAGNDRNSEYLFAITESRQRNGNTWMALSLPPAHPEPGPNFAAQFRYYDDFVNSFDDNDTRRDFFMTEYTNLSGTFVQLLGDDNSRSMKYYDSLRVGSFQENDWPIVRYADILLSRAEALNEINGPGQEAIDLINLVRDRAGVDDIVLEDFTKETLRDHILQERAWEFYSEAQRRTDLIRHGKFIEQAIARGKPAEPHHVLYPIPQTEINANPNLVQNDGY